MFRSWLSAPIAMSHDDQTSVVVFVSNSATRMEISDANI